MRTRHRLLSALVVLGVVASACGGDDDDTTSTDTPPATEAPTDSGETPTTSPTTSPAIEGASITIALGSEPTSLDPHIVDDGGERAINDNIYETLLARTPDGELIPSLATDLPTLIDDTTWEFTLREGVTFHDGTPFNADAVVATVERMIGLIAAEGTDNAGFYDTLTGATAIDEHTVQITTSGPDGVLPARMYWLKIVTPADAAKDDLSSAPNGTGPYAFVERETGVAIELAAYAGYWGDAPSIADVTYRFVTEGGTRLAGLKSGQYDLITNLPPNDVAQAPQAAAIQGQENPIIILDADDGITADVNVRKALNLALDKQAIADVVYAGYAVPVDGQLLSPSILGHNDDINAYPYDPEQAKQLLEEAGVAGETITLVGESSGRWLNDRELVEAIASYWTEAGLNVDLQTPEFGAYLDVLFDRSNRADAIFVSSSNDLLDPSRQLNTYYSLSGVGSSNSNAELQQLVADGQSSLDADERATIYQEAVQIAYDEAYFAFLVSNQDLYGLSERMEWTPRVDSKLLVKEMSVNG
ncbi:MAG TPA: ABC transporter substrate-binding protein [Ilumatobacter sp.]|nr:ABC transporter substrate-binding protein [Ilumatobacter sp.]